MLFRSQLVQKLSDYLEYSKESSEVIKTGGLNQIDNWYVWEMQFDPMTITKMEVYFIVYTPTTLIKGYGKKDANAFEYILQTGSSWKDRIMQGNIIVNLKDGLNINKIIGTYPLQHVFFNDKQLLYHFTDLKPKAEDDLIIWYQGDTTSTFETLHPSSLYKQVDETDTSIVHRSNLTILEKTDFDTPLPGWSYIL